MTMENTAPDSKDIENHLLSIVASFIKEYKTERALASLSLNASLDKDLGIDSLGRVELFLRIEKAFNVVFPDNLIAEVDTLKDILNAVQSIMQMTPQKESQFSRHFVTHLEEARFDPSTASTLIEVLIKHAITDPERPHLYLMNEKGAETIIRYGQLLEAARKVASGLIELGLKKGNTVALMLPTGESFFYAFFGILLAGGIPVPIYPPVRPDKIEEYALREATILNNAEVRILITFAQVETLGRLLRVFIKSLNSVTTVESLMLSKQTLPNFAFHTHEPALIQYTSGSTAAPKGVLLSHANLLANIRTAGQAMQITSADVGISWLPLYHDMGLIGAWFCCLYQGIPLTIMSPLTFLNRPERWLWAIHYHRGTLSAGPNFAYELCIRRIKEEDIVGLDLSSWRLAFNGAEAINPCTIERFTQKFAPYGFKPEALFPVYGLAECSVAVSFPTLNRKPLIDEIKRDLFEQQQLAIPALKTDSSTLKFVGCGKPLPLHDIRIVDDKIQELPERHVGSLQFCGPSAMQGYYRNIEATKAIYYDGWWDSGDYAYIAEGEVYITGRKKDIIIKAGRNLYPQEIEEVASQAEGVRRGCVVAVGILDAKMGTEKLVIIAETVETKSKNKALISAEITEKITVVIGLPPDEVYLVPPRTIPKTSSGKLQRSATKKMILEGKLAKGRLPAWLQMGKLMLLGSIITLQTWLRKLLQFFYTVYVAILFLLFLPFLIASLCLPKNVAHTFFRVFLKLLLICAGFRIEIKGKENLSLDKTVIYVSNHASYIDSILLLTVLPENVLFVAKKEVLNWPLVKTVVRKFGYITVDRMDFTKSIEDAEMISKILQDQKSILIYPEGTFTYATGLRPFKLGAFKLAVDTKTPIVPVGIEGTRTLFQMNHRLLTFTKIKITFCKTIEPTAKDWSEVTRLHAAVRQEILMHCGEQSLDLVMAGPQKSLM